MSNDANIPALGEAYRHVMEMIGEAQAAVTIARDRNDGALAALARVADGSIGAEEITTALAVLIEADGTHEDIITLQLRANELIAAHIQRCNL